MKSLLLSLLAVPATAQLLLDLQGHDTTDPRHQSQNHLTKRKTVEQDLVQKFAYYEATVSVGTPGQQIKLLLDTGSSDMWVLGQNVNCGGGGIFSQGIDCTQSGVFDTSKSSTYHKNESIPFDIKYSDGSESKGFYGTDNLGLGGTTLNDFTFAVADSASDGQAVLGIGPIENEQSLYTDNPVAYANLPLALTPSRRSSRLPTSRSELTPTTSLPPRRPRPSTLLSPRSTSRRSSPRPSETPVSRPRSRRSVLSSKRDFRICKNKTFNPFYAETTGLRPGHESYL